MRRRLLYTLTLGLIVLLALVALFLSQRPLAYGDTVRGVLDDNNFFDDYWLESKEGDVISVEMKRVHGNLNPGIRLYDSNGKAIAHSEHNGGGRNALLRRFRIPSDGSFYIHALRNAAGETGEYEPTLTSSETIRVDSLCSLDDAISAANKDQAVGNCPTGNGPDIVVLMTDTELPAELPSITSTITILGGGYTISSGGAYRIFYVEDTAALSMDNVILANGRGEYVDLDGFVLGDGGAIVNWGELIISNSTIRHNSAVFAGGAIANYSEGSITIGHSRIHGNAGEESGGAIVNYIHGNVTITDSIISDNSASFSGGAMFNNGQLSIRNCDITGNSAKRGFGGAIVNNTKATIISSRFTGNSTADDGGAIGSWGELSISDSDFSNNRARDDGGAITSWGELNITSSNFNGNSAGDGGGAIDSSGQLTVTASVFTDNSAKNGGGAIDNYTEDGFTIIDSIFSNNTPVDIYPESSE